jgi:hypothetical protein
MISVVVKFVKKNEVHRKLDVTPVRLTALVGCSVKAIILA